jgi:hypothetical protein
VNGDVSVLQSPDRGSGRRIQLFRRSLFNIIVISRTLHTVWLTSKQFYLSRTYSFLVPMSGFEVIAAVTAIIGAFNGSLTLFRDWSEMRRERREHAENCRLEQSLILGGSAVQSEYDSDFARLGRRFGIGDGKASKDLALQSNE